MNTAAGNTIDVGEKLDHGAWSKYQKLILFFVGFTVVFDGLDIQVLGLSIPALMKELGGTRADYAPIIALSLIGMTIGTAIGGMIGDRYGRRIGLIGSVFTFGALTALTALANDLQTITVLRFFAGVGLGGALPNSSALAAEITPLRNRAQSVLLTILCVPLGSFSGGFIASLVLPTSLGWRGLFVIGGVLPIIVAIALIFLLPESPRFLARFKERRAELAKLLTRFGNTIPDNAEFVDLADKSSGKTSLLALFTPEYWRDTVALWIAGFFCLLGTYSVLSWLPSVLSDAGLNSATASTGITSYNLGGVIGVIISTLIIRRIGSKPLMLTLCAGVILSALYLRGMTITAENSTEAILIIGVMGLFLNATQTSMYALAANVYVSRIRGTGIGGALGIGRVGGVLSSFVVPFALSWNGSAGYFTLIALVMFATLLALTMVSRHVPKTMGDA